MATSKGTIENTSGGVLNIFGLGWRMPTGYTETVTAEIVTAQQLRQAEDELESLITAGDIEIQSATGNVVASGGVAGWIDTEISDNAPTTHVLTFSMDQRVPASGERWFQWNTAITLLEVRWPINSTFTILRTNLGAEDVDSSNTYGLRLYASSDINTPLWESGVILPVSTRSAGVNWPLSSPLTWAAGSYLWSAYRVSGSGNSDFNKLLTNIFYLRED